MATASDAPRSYWSGSQPGSSPSHSNVRTPHHADTEVDTCLDELRDILPEHQPRFLVYSSRMQHSDGRVSYPMTFIYITPRDSQRDLQVMYAGTKLALQKEADLTRVYEVRELDEMTDEWLAEKLSK
ncbi:hypothetical protein J6590_071164 [Homalodisca vitripennis]|nr:hypothetical protein J6590_071164 [Homalodisca vitripennis]